jgi:hypothetical protein
MIIHRQMIMERLRMLTALQDQEREPAEALKLTGQIAECLHWLEIQEEMERAVPEIEYEFQNSRVEL